MEVTAVLIVTATIFVWGVLLGPADRADLTAPDRVRRESAPCWRALGARRHAASAPETPQAAGRGHPGVGAVLRRRPRPGPASSVATSAGTRGCSAIGLPLTVLAGWGLAAWFFPELGVWLGAAGRGGARADRRGPRGPRGDQPGGARPDPPTDHRGERPQRRDRHAGRDARDRRGRVRRGARGCAGPGEALARAGRSAPSSVRLWGSPAGWLLRWARRRGWAAEDFAGIAVLALALVAYTAALAAGRQRLRRGVLRRPRLRGRGRAPRARRAGVPGAGRRPGLAAGVARVRRGRRPDHARSRRPRPWCCTPCSASPSSGWCPVALACARRGSRPRHGAVRRLVRAPRARLPGVRAARAGGPGPGGTRRWPRSG